MHVLILVLLFIYFMHDELKNIRIIELELFKRMRCAIRRRMHRDELHYMRSERGAEAVGAEGQRSRGDALTSMGSCVPPVKTPRPSRSLLCRGEETRRGGSSEGCRDGETPPESLILKP